MISKLKEKKWLALYLAGMALLVLYLVFSNRIMVSLDQTLSKTEPISTAELQELIRPAGLDEGEIIEADGQVRQSGDRVHFSLFVDEPAQNTMDTVSFYGTAACASDGNIPDKHTDILLIGKKHFYKISTTLFFTEDVTHWEKYGIPAGAHTYRGTFSTLGLANDVYRVGLYVWENEQTSGFIDTQTKWEKSFSGFHKYESEEIAPISPDDDSPVAFMLSYDQSKPDGDDYVFYGFAAKMDHDSVASTVYVNLTFEDGTVRTFTTNHEDNPWFEEYLGSELYNFAQFTARIPKKATLGKTAQVDILVDNDGVSLYREEDMLLRFEEDGMKEVCAEAVAQAPEVSTGREAHGNGEAYARSDCYKFTGTAYLSDGMAGTPEIFLEIRRADGTAAVYPAAVSRSQWMAENVGEEYAMSAYTAKISKEDLGEQNIQLRLLVEDGGAVYRAEEILTFLWQDGQLVQQ